MWVGFKKKRFFPAMWCTTKLQTFEKFFKQLCCYSCSKLKIPFSAVKF